jgi:hypothetical protein
MSTRIIEVHCESIFVYRISAGAIFQTQEGLYGYTFKAFLVSLTFA